MELSHITFLAFAACSGLRIVSYAPQIYRVAIDTNGASAIAYSTWVMWTGANLATGLYAAVNLGDTYLAGVSLVYAACCIAVIGLTMVKRRGFAARMLAWPVQSRQRSTGSGAAMPAPSTLGLVVASVVALIVSFAAVSLALERAMLGAIPIADHAVAVRIAPVEVSADEPAGLAEDIEVGLDRRRSSARPSAGPTRFKLHGNDVTIDSDRLSVRGAYGNFDIRP